MFKKILCASALLFSTFAFGADGSEEEKGTKEVELRISLLLFPGMGETVIPYFTKDTCPPEDKEIIYPILSEISDLELWKRMSTHNIGIDSPELPPLVLDYQTQNILVTSFLYVPGRKLTIKAGNLIVRGCLIADEIEFDVAGTAIVYTEHHRTASLEALCEKIKATNSANLRDVPWGTVATLGVGALTIQAKNFINIGGLIKAHSLGITADVFKTGGTSFVGVELQILAFLKQLALQS